MVGLPSKHEADYLCDGLPRPFACLFQVAQNGLPFRRFEDTAHPFKQEPDSSHISLPTPLGAHEAVRLTRITAE